MTGLWLFSVVCASLWRWRAPWLKEHVFSNQGCAPRTSGTGLAAGPRDLSFTQGSGDYTT